MLLRVSLEQTRFRVPGLHREPRGAVLGEKVLLLFSSIDRLVRFLRAYSAVESLDALASGLEIVQVRTALRTTELVLSTDASSTAEADRVAAIARLAGGLVFTGTDRHFVKLRDASAPLGYDVESLLGETAEFCLYHDSFAQAYAAEHVLSLGDLLLRLAPVRARGRRPAPESALVLAEPGLTAPLVAHALRRCADARVAVVDAPRGVAGTITPRARVLVRLARPPAHVLDLFTATPGVRAFELAVEHVGVEVGFVHPVTLSAATSFFAPDRLWLLSANEGPTVISPPPCFVPADTVVARHVLEPARAHTPLTPAQEDVPKLPLRVVAGATRSQAPAAVRVPRAQAAWLGRLLYLLPTAWIEGLELAAAEDELVLIGTSGLEGLPLGRPYVEAASNVFVPVGFRVTPALPPTSLAALVRASPDARVFLEPDGAAHAFARDAFGPLARRMLPELLPAVRAARPLDDARHGGAWLAYDEADTREASPPPDGRSGP